MNQFGILLKTEGCVLLGCELRASPICNAQLWQEQSENLIPPLLDSAEGRGRTFTRFIGVGVNGASFSRR
jgi:hypothetical protein